MLAQSVAPSNVGEVDSEHKGVGFNVLEGLGGVDDLDTQGLAVFPVTRPEGRFLSVAPDPVATFLFLLTNSQRSVTVARWKRH
jgi:hypothetical protein